MSHLCQWETKDLSEFVGNKSAVESLTKWFDSLRAQKGDTKRAALLVGPCGVGKNLVADLLFEKGGLDVIRSDCSELRTQKVFKEKLENAFSHSNVSKALGSDRPFAMVIDDVQLFTPRNGLTDLVRLLNPLRGKRNPKQAEKDWFKSYWPIPIICISSCRKDDAKIADLKKDCELIVFDSIEDSDMHRAIRTIADREGLIMDQRLVELVGGDFRKMLNVMADLKMGLRIDTVVKNHARIRSCSTLKENTLMAFNQKNLTVQQSLKLFDEDRHQLPQMVYENYSSKIRSVEDAREVLENLCIADSLENNDQELDTADDIAKIHGLLTIYCCNTVFSRCNERFRVPKSTTAFSKTSAMHVTIKKVASILNNSTFSNMKLEDLQVLQCLDCDENELFDIIGIKQDDLRKLSSKMPLKLTDDSH